MSIVTPIADLRDQFMPIRDQGSRPTCLAFAVSDAHGSLIESGTILSCEYLHYHAQKFGGRDITAGATLSNVLQALKIEGQPPEQDWPYIPNLSKSDVSRQHPPLNITGLHRRNSLHCGNISEDVRHYLDQGSSVISLIYLCEPFFAAQAGQIIKASANAKPDVNVRHAVITVGYGKTPEGRCYLIRNSWGDQWADNGYAWIAEDLFEASLFDIALLKDGSYVSSNTIAA